MTGSTNTQESLKLGFLTAVEISEHGFVGGLLLTNRHGRPLEFQCTLPVKPNRTQEILYGPTLIAFLMGDLIARTLLEKVGSKPHLVLVDNPEILGLRQHVEVPIGLVEPRANGEQPAIRSIRFDEPHTLEGERFLSQLPKEADLNEPFIRVREALQETVRAGAPR